MELNRFAEYFYQKPKSHGIHKWLHYFDIYDRHMKRFQGINPLILEIGVQNGGSLDMWNYYFNNQCEIVGVDIDKNCLNLQKDFKNAKIIIGDQGDENFWRDFVAKMPKFDIIIDDGGHTMNQQIITMKYLLNHLNNHGVYICEDTHTSYWGSFGGGCRRKGTFIEHCKDLVDSVNSHHHHEDTYKDLGFANAFKSISFYDSVVVLEREDKIHPPQNLNLPKTI